MNFALILGNLGNTCDRFLSSGYKDQPAKEEMIKQAASIDGVKGIELVGSWDVTTENTEQIGTLLDKYNLQCASIIPDHFSQKRWGSGTLAAKDGAIRCLSPNEARRDQDMLLDAGWRHTATIDPARWIEAMANGAKDPSDMLDEIS